MNNFCQNCGSPLRENANFCPNCGYKRDDVVVFSFASGLERLFAYIIDAFVFYIISRILGFMITELFYEQLQSFTSDQLEMLGIIVGVPVFWLYYASMESSPLQGTIGKFLLGFKLVDYNGNRISFLRATIRTFSKYISLFIFFIGFIMIAYTKNKQGLHDLIAKTYVIKK